MGLTISLPMLQLTILRGPSISLKKLALFIPFQAQNLSQAPLKLVSQARLKLVIGSGATSFR
eukprot:1385857-Amorphochlora_amoeboformis.AAC.1